MIWILLLLPFLSSFSATCVAPLVLFRLEDRWVPMVVLFRPLGRWRGRTLSVPGD